VNGSHSLLRLNVGFIIHQTVGYSRDFSIDYPSIHFAPDLDLKHFSGSIRVSRTAHGLLLQADMEAQISTDCVRCLDDFSQPLEIHFTELFAFSKNSVTDSELIVPEDGVLDLEPLIREEMLVAIPMNPLCKPDCEGLCPICGANRNINSCDHEEEEIDPRMSVLKALLDEG
jgi:uncharacterized protein